MGVLVGGCCLTALFSFTSTSSLEATVALPGLQGEPGGRLAARLQEFPSTVQLLERRLVDLEHSVLELAEGGLRPTTRPPPTPAGQGPADGGSAQAPSSGAAAGAAAPEAALPTTPTAADVEELPPGVRFRPDQRCGKNIDERLADGGPVECDPAGDFPCCSELGWCGNSEDHCSCQGCVDYRNSPERPGRQGRGTTVVVIIPFRDREGHLVKFKEYWRWFAKEGRVPRKVDKWEVYVIEQFDSQTFNRGWNFNVGLAIASGQTSASPDVTPDMKVAFDCAVIQDIDYLPEKGVDYSDCAVPIQLSAEIDRYNWKTPYLQSAGGIVGMNLKHWQKINGFGNNYFGWGGEDDELHHRLRLNNLLFGDCYPYCKGKNDPNIGQRGLSIKRPSPGYGRFSGKYMHSANHTKRITDSRAYAKNVKMLQEIAGGSDRWKSDGLSSLAFRILQVETDDSDSTDGVVYHHIKVHRGRDPYNVGGILLAVPKQLCDEGGERRAGPWSVVELGREVPWDLAALRQRAAAVLEAAGGSCPSFTVKSLSFLLVDRRRHLAKILSDGDPRLLTVFYRSLGSPEADGLIIADARGRAELQSAFVKAGAFVEPTTDFCICTSPLPSGGPKYSVHQGSICSGGGWEKLDGHDFRAYAKPRNGMQAISWCDNEKHWTQRVVRGEHCEKKWAGLKWVHGGTLWAARGHRFCVGTRQREEGLSFSKVLAKERCDEDGGFKHDFNFDGVAEQHAPAASMVWICRLNDVVKVSRKASDCEEDGTFLVAEFPARATSAADPSDRRFCVHTSDNGAEITESAECEQEKLSFALPKAPAASSLPSSGASTGRGHSRTKVCASAGQIEAGVDCTGSVVFEVPSPADVAASTPVAAAGVGPLYTLVEEEVPCFGFLCASTMSALAS